MVSLYLSKWWWPGDGWLFCPSYYPGFANGFSYCELQIQKTCSSEKWLWLLLGFRISKPKMNRMTWLCRATRLPGYRFTMRWFLLKCSLLFEGNFGVSTGLTKSRCFFYGQFFPSCQLRVSRTLQRCNSTHSKSLRMLWAAGPEHMPDRMSE